MCRTIARTSRARPLRPFAPRASPPPALPNAQLDSPDDKVHSMFIKCIKPNGSMTPDLPDPGYILPQLHTQGILHAVTLAKLGFPHRFKCDEVHSKFGKLIDTLVAEGSIPPELAGLPPQNLVRALLEA